MYRASTLQRGDDGEAASACGGVEAVQLTRSTYFAQRLKCCSKNNPMQLWKYARVTGKKHFSRAAVFSEWTPSKTLWDGVTYCVVVVT